MFSHLNYTTPTYSSHPIQTPLTNLTLGLDFPSITYSPHRLPSYFPPLPRTPAHRAELLVLVTLGAVAKVVGSPLRPCEETPYWTMGVAGGRWSSSQLVAGEAVLHAWLKTVNITGEGVWAIKAEMEKVAEQRGKLFSYF